MGELTEKYKMTLQDTLVNFVANLNTSKDKRAQSVYCRTQFLTRDFKELLALYHEDWAASKIVDLIPDEMTRKWRTFSSTQSDASSEIAAFEAAEEELNLRHKTNLAVKWARLFGGAVMVMGVEGTGELDEPLNLNDVKQGSFQFLNVVERPLVAVNLENATIFNPLTDKFGEPEFYTFANNTEAEFFIHSSRVVRFRGIRTPRFGNLVNEFWGDSAITRVYAALLDYNIATTTAAGLMTQSNVDVFYIENLYELLSTENGTSKLQTRFQELNVGKSTVNAMILDKREQLMRQAIDLGGLPQLIDQMLKNLSAASFIPATLFIGESASGLSNTGETDLRNFYDRVSASQEMDLRPALNKLDQVIYKSTTGQEMPKDLTFDFNPLWQIPDETKAAIEVQNAQTDAQYFNLGIIPPEVILRRLQKAGTYQISDELIEETEAIGSFAPTPLDISDTPT